MDQKSRRLALEIVEAALGREMASSRTSLAELHCRYVAVGAALAEADTDGFARSLASRYGDDPGALVLMQDIVMDLHRKAVDIAAEGAEFAVLALQLGGADAGEAAAWTAWQLRSIIAEDDVPGDSTDDLLVSANGNYVRAAGDLRRLGSQSEHSEFRDLAETVLGDVVCFAVCAAAHARAA